MKKLLIAGMAFAMVAHAEEVKSQEERVEEAIAHSVQAVEKQQESRNKAFNQDGIQYDKERMAEYLEAQRRNAQQIEVEVKAIIQGQPIRKSVSAPQNTHE